LSLQKYYFFANWQKKIRIVPIQGRYTDNYQTYTIKQKEIFSFLKPAANHRSGSETSKMEQEKTDILAPIMLCSSRGTTTVARHNPTPRRQIAQRRKIAP
jgi:hypothetical protein